MSAQDDDHPGPPPLSVRDGRFSGDRALRPWSWRLGVFLRALAAFELLKGVAHWGLLISAGGAAEPFGEQSRGWAIEHGLFAVLDPVAAVGLWVGAAWGVAIWLIAAVAQIAVSALGGPTALGWIAMAATLAAMAGYLALSMKARAENR